MAGPPDPDARSRTIAVVALGGIVAIVVAAAGLRSWLARRATETNGERVSPASVEPLAAGYFPRVTLRGPDGEQTIPSLMGPTVVHVWLQGCQDCMPAFEAMQRSAPCRGRVVNVAYGEASPSWAANYGVGTNLVFDRGGAGVVRPLGIGSFTTFVVSRSGEILVRDRPDSPTYRSALAPYCEES